MRTLLILGCSSRKRGSARLLSAIDRYDGPAYRILRKYLRRNQWPQKLSVGVLSARYGLIGILKRIEDYDQRMDAATANAKAIECAATLRRWANEDHDSVHLCLGKDYLPALKPALESLPIPAFRLSGPIGHKNRQLKTMLESAGGMPRVNVDIEGGTGRCRYFLPDWDDLLDPAFDFEKDRFSGSTRGQRGDKHCAVLMQPHRMSDGILVSLAQHQSSKGPLKKLEGTETTSLAPVPLRPRFGLTDSQYLFGDPGAFSYVDQDEPSVSIDQSIALYEAYGFDFGASVDHIPVETIRTGANPRNLSADERQARVEITCRNAEVFIAKVNERKAGFTPVGTIQGLNPDQYGEAVPHYAELGYRHLAIGGLVPLSDRQVEEVVGSVMAAADDLPSRPWVHLFGVFRPKLQRYFRDLGVDSFDSATYFRKAWLRSGQNYLSTDGDWYAAIRVPMTGDPRTRKRLVASGADLEKLRTEEDKVLRLLCRYGRHEVSINDALEAIINYDSKLSRSSDNQSMKTKYRRTLESRPWERCACNFCRTLGIHMLIFRGANRNKRRGAHNTLMLYRQIGRRAR